MAVHSKGRALLVEDSSHGIGALAGFETRSVGKTRDALELTAAEPFDVVILDVDLPLVDGASFLKKLNEVAQSPSVIFVGKHPSNELAATAAELGVHSQTLSKPVDAKVLGRVASAAVERNHRFSEVLKLITRPSKPLQSVPATSAKNEFGNVLDKALLDGAVVITKHDAEKAVLVSLERLSELVAKREPNLEALRAEFDQMVARMRSPEGKAAARKIFTLPPSAFGDAAVAGAKQRG